MPKSKKLIILRLLLGFIFSRVEKIMYSAASKNPTRVMGNIPMSTPKEVKLQ